jgi:hypothetical protein
VFAGSKTFLFEHLLNEDGEGLVEILKGNKLRQMMDKFIMLSSPNVRNLVAFFKHWLRNKQFFTFSLLKQIMVTFLFKIVIFQGNKLERKCLCSRCLCMDVI